MCSDVGTKIRLVPNGIFPALGPRSRLPTLTKGHGLARPSVHEHPSLAFRVVRGPEQALRSLSSFDNAEHIIAVLDAAGELDRELRGHRRGARRAMVAVLMFTRLCISERAPAQVATPDTTEDAIALQSVRRPSGPASALRLSRRARRSPTRIGQSLSAR